MQLPACRRVSEVYADILVSVSAAASAFAIKRNFRTPPNMTSAYADAKSWELAVALTCTLAQFFGLHSHPTLAEKRACLRDIPAKYEEIINKCF